MHTTIDAIKKIIILLGVLTSSVLNAATFLADPDFSSGSLITGTASGNIVLLDSTTNTIVVDYGFVGQVDVNGTATNVNATFTINDFSATDGLDLSVAVNRVGVTLRPDGTGPNNIAPFVTGTLSFTFDDDSAANIEGLFLNYRDIDSNANDNLSDVGGIENGQFSSSQLTDDTSLFIATTPANGLPSTAIGFTTAQLIGLTGSPVGGASDPNPTQEEEDNVSAEFTLNTRSSFDLIFGVSGADSNGDTNRGVNAGFSITSIFPSTTPTIPEPTVFTLLALSSLGLLIRRRK